VALSKPAISLLTILFSFPAILLAQPSQQPAKTAPAEAEKQSAHTDNAPEKPQLPFQIQLLETQLRFQANGDWCKEVHTIVKIINILGVQQFARLSFDYNHSFQQVEIPLIRITHANGGTSELLPSAVTDGPNSAVAQFPAYEDVRVKSVRILGLEEGDTVEYRVITNTSHAPLAPEFWAEHSFDRSGQVLNEHYEVAWPASTQVQIHINSATPVSSKQNIGTGQEAFSVYRWNRRYSPKSEAGELTPDPSAAPDIAISTFSWEGLSSRLAEALLPTSHSDQKPQSGDHPKKDSPSKADMATSVREKAVSLTHNFKTDLGRLKAIYDFVSTQISTVDLPLGATGFHSRPAADILKSAYATGEDKYVLFHALAAAVNLQTEPVLTGFCGERTLAIPAPFKHLVVLGSTPERQYWLDPAVEVAPFGMILPSEAKCALLLRDSSATNAARHDWIKVPSAPPFPAYQQVSVDAAISEKGELMAKVKYVLRGENELLLRVAFHQAPKDKWKDVAAMLALSDGFRGQVTRAEASDPLSTNAPFTVEYQLIQPRFVDWSKSPVRIPALLPQIGLPDLPSAQSPQGSALQVDLGNPLNVQIAMTLRLPKGTTVEIPAGTTVARDYATYVSKYSSTQNSVAASRRVDFLKRQIVGDSTVDYTAFVRVVQNDQAQRLVLVLPSEHGNQ
jgi:hypothetical protein